MPAGRLCGAPDRARHRRQRAGAAQLRATTLFGLCSLVPYAVYLLVVFWLSLRLTLTATLASATLA
jgi:uncharacterized membrane protein (GlpM family)